LTGRQCAVSIQPPASGTLEERLGLPAIGRQVTCGERAVTQTEEEDPMERVPMNLHVKKNLRHKDVGNAPGNKITEVDIAKETSKGGVYAKRAQFAENAKKWKHPIKGKR
jgi:hypothetical protein